MQSHAARARARQDPAQLRLSRDDLPRGSLRRRRPGSAARDGCAAHDHDLTARVSRLRQTPADRVGRNEAQPSHRYHRHARDHRAPCRRAAACRRAHGRRRGVHGAHVGHHGRREGGDEYASQRRVRDLGVRGLGRPDGQGRHSRPCAAVPRHRPHRSRHARGPDRQPLGVVLPVRGQRGVPFGGTAPRYVHGFVDHGLHRVAEQRCARQVRPVVIDQALHGRRTDAGDRARGLARPDRRAHPADVRPHRSDFAHAYDAAWRDPADRSAHGCDVGRRAGVQYARQSDHRRRHGSRAARNRRVRDRGAADRARLLAETRGNGQVADDRRA